MDNFRDSYFPIKWDLTKRRLDGLVWGKQYDTGRGLSITVINGGQVVSPTTEVIRLRWEKPDNTTGLVNSTIVNGKFVIEGLSQMFTVNGSVRADLGLWVDGEEISSVTIYVQVEKAVAVGAIESSDTFTALQQVLTEAGNLETEYTPRLAAAESQLLEKVPFSEFVGGRRKGASFLSDKNDIAWTWWVSNAVKLNKKRYIGAVTRDGIQSLLSITDDGVIERTVFNDIESDDHNPVAIVLGKDNKPIVFYTRHGVDNVMRYRNGLDIEGIGNFGEEKTLVSSGEVTYAQAFRYNNIVALFYRCNNVDGSHWAYRRSVDYGVTFGDEILIFKGTAVYTKFQQSKSSPNLINAFVYEHPITGTTHNIYQCRITLDGLHNISKKVNGSTVEIAAFNNPASLPLLLPTLRLAYDASLNGNKNVRLLDVSDTGLAFAYVTFTNTTDAEYFVREDGTTNWLASAKVANAGLPFEVPAGANYYFGGLAFLSGNNRIVYISRESAGAWYIEKYKSTNGTVYTLDSVVESSATEKLIRPTCYLGGSELDPGFYQKGSFTTYMNYNTNLVTMAVPEAAVVEGDWTPTMFGTTTAGTPTYTEQFGRFQKIGNWVTVRFRVTITDKGGMAGSMRIGALPYTVKAGTNATGGVCPTYSGITAPNGLTLMARAGEKAATVYSAGVLFDTLNIANATMVMGSITYEV